MKRSALEQSLSWNNRWTVISMLFFSNCSGKRPISLMNTANQLPVRGELRSLCQKLRERKKLVCLLLQNSFFEAHPPSHQYFGETKQICFAKVVFYRKIRFLGINSRTWMDQGIVYFKTLSQKMSRAHRGSLGWGVVSEQRGPGGLLFWKKGGPRWQDAGVLGWGRGWMAACRPMELVWRGKHSYFQLWEVKTRPQTIGPRFTERHILPTLTMQSVLISAGKAIPGVAITWTHLLLGQQSRDLPLALHYLGFSISGLKYSQAFWSRDGILDGFVVPREGPLPLPNLWTMGGSGRWWELGTHPLQPVPFLATKGLQRRKHRERKKYGGSGYEVVGAWP